MIAVTGSVAAGMVWGWLAGRLITSIAATVVIVCASAVEALLLAGPAAAVAALIGGMLGVWSRTLLTRLVRGSTSGTR
jgi:hypothetical protein